MHIDHETFKNIIEEKTGKKCFIQRFTHAVGYDIHGTQYDILFYVLDELAKNKKNKDELVKPRDDAQEIINEFPDLPYSYVYILVKKFGYYEVFDFFQVLDHFNWEQIREYCESSFSEEFHSIKKYINQNF